MTRDELLKYSFLFPARTRETVERWVRYEPTRRGYLLRVHDVENDRYRVITLYVSWDHAGIHSLHRDLFWAPLPGMLKDSHVCVFAERGFTHVWPEETESHA